VGLAVVLGVSACGSGKKNATPAATASSTTAAPASSPGPGPQDWLDRVHSDGRTLYVTSHSCPGKVAAGFCTISGFTRKLKAFPLTLWRYTDGSWEDLGQPGVFSYSDLEVLRDVLVFVPRTDSPSSGGAATGPLRVSLDAGKTWNDWAIPQQPRRCHSTYSGPGTGGPCTVAVAGDYVVIASPLGWIRRHVASSTWEDVTPPKRAASHDFDSLDHGLLALDDGTLLATVNNCCSNGPKGFFRVSKDFGATWGGPQPNPGEHSQVTVVDGSAVYAECFGKDYSCGWYKSTDLEHWRKATVAEVHELNDGRPTPCRRVYRPEGPSRRQTDSSVRVGALVYGITYVPYVKGREATHKELRHFDLPHQVRHVLEVSTDRCVWRPVPTT
jgi:hypothetical protein